MLTILHGADFHLDAPFSSLPPERAEAQLGHISAGTWMTPTGHSFTHS